MLFKRQARESSKLKGFEIYDKFERQKKNCD